MSLTSVGAALRLEVQLHDGAASKFPQARVYDQAGTEVSGSPFDLTHLAQGLYTNSAFTVAVGNTKLRAVYIVYNESGHTTESVFHTRAFEHYDVETQVETVNAKLGTPAGASVSADIAAVKTDTGTLTSRLTSGRAANLDNLDTTISSRASASALATVQADTDDIQAKIGTPVVTLAADAAAVKADTAAILDDTGTTGVAIANGAITAAKFATGAVDANAIADNAIDGGALASSAIAKIVNGVWDEVLASHLAAGTFGANVNLIDDIKGVVDNFTSADSNHGVVIPSFITIPAAGSETYRLYFRNLDLGVPANPAVGPDIQITLSDGTPIIAFTAMTNEDVGIFYYDYVVNSTDTENQLVVKVRHKEAVPDPYLTLIASTNRTDISANTTDILAQTTAIKGKTDQLVFASGRVESVISSAQEDAIVDKVWDEAQSGHVSAGSFGKRLDADTSTRESEASASARAATSQTEHDATQTDIAALSTKVGTPAGVSVSADVAAVKSDTVAILLDTGTDGVLIASAEKDDIVDRVWNEAQAGHTTAGTFGKRLDADVTTRESESDASTRAAADIAGHGATQAALVILQADTDDIQSKIGTPASTVSADVAAVKADTAAILVDTGTSGVLIATAEKDDIVDKVWDESQAGHVSAGTFGKYLDVEVSSRESETSAAARALADIAEHNATQADIAVILVDTDDIQAKIGTPTGTVSSDIAGVKSDTAAIKAKTDLMVFTTGEIHSRVVTNLDKINYTILAADKDALVDLIWNEFLTPAHTTAGTAGKALIDAAGITATAIADAVWDALVADHADANTFGLLVDVIRQFVTVIDNEVNSGVHGLAVIQSNVTSQAAGVIVEVNANETKIDAIIPAITAAKVAVITEVDANEVKINAIVPAVNAAKVAVIAEVDANEVKIDIVDSKVGTLSNNTRVRLVVPERIIKPTAGFKDYEFRIALYDSVGNSEAPDAAPTLRIRRLDTSVDIVVGAVMIQDGVKVGVYYYNHTISSGTDTYPLLVEIAVVEGGATRYYPALSEITEFESDLTAIQAQVAAMQIDVTTIENEVLNVGHGLAAIRTKEDDIVSEINANEAILNLIKPQTDLIPASPATSAQVAAVTTAVLTRPDITAIQTRLDLLRDNLKGASAKDLTQVYNVFDLTPVAKTADPRFANLDALISSRSTLTAGTVWGYVTRTLTATGGLTATDLDAIWSYLVSQATTPNSIGKRIADFLDAAISSRATAVQVTSALAGVAQESTLNAATGTIVAEINVNEGKLNTVLSDTATIKAKTNNLPSSPASEGTVQSENDATQLQLAAVALNVSSIKSKTDNLPVDPAKETSVLARPTNPLLTTDGRLARLDVNVSTRGTLSAGDLVPIAKTTDVVAAQSAVIAEVDANEVKIDALSTLSGAIKAKTDTIPVNPATEANVDAAEAAILLAIAGIPLPVSPLTAADIWTYGTRTLTTSFPDISLLAEKTDLVPLAKIQYVLQLSTSFNSTTGDQEVLAWIEKDGQRAVGANCVVTVKTALGVTSWTGTLATPNADGVFRFVNPILAVADANYYVQIDIDLDSSTHIGRRAFTTVG